MRIADLATAEALEAPAHICPPKTVMSLTGSIEKIAQRDARMCNDHVAGRLGVEILDALPSSSWLVPATDGFDVTVEGRAGFDQLGVDVDSLRRQRRVFARACIDWTERRPHLSGAVGAGLAAACLNRQWIQRRPRHCGLNNTPAGAAALRIC